MLLLTHKNSEKKEDRSLMLYQHRQRFEIIKNFFGSLGLFLKRAIFIVFYPLKQLHNFSNWSSSIRLLRYFFSFLMIVSLCLGVFAWYHQTYIVPERLKKENSLLLANTQKAYFFTKSNYESLKAQVDSLSTVDSVNSWQTLIGTAQKILSSNTAVTIAENSQFSESFVDRALSSLPASKKASESREKSYVGYSLFNNELVDYGNREKDFVEYFVCMGNANRAILQSIFDLGQKQRDFIGNENSLSVEQVKGFYTNVTQTYMSNTGKLIEMEGCVSGSGQKVLEDEQKNQVLEQLNKSKESYKLLVSASEKVIAALDKKDQQAYTESLNVFLEAAKTNRGISETRFVNKHLGESFTKTQQAYTELSLAYDQFVGTYSSSLS
jgi:hypothetical protein